VRPLDALSIGFIATDPYYDSRDFKIGLAVRPLFFLEKDGHRLSIAADISTTGWMRPRFDISIVPIDGLTLAASYEVGTNSFSVDISFSLAQLQAGFRYFDRTKGAFFIHLHPRVFQSFASYYPQYRVFESKPLVEAASEPLLFLDRKTTLREMVSKIGALKDDPRISGILLKNFGFITNFAGYLELKDALLQFKSKGKKITWYFETASMLSYALAAAVADELYLNPQGMVDVRGFYSTKFYFKDLFDKAGIKVVNINSHPHKSAGDVFTESEMTDEERESLSTVLNDMAATYHDLILDGRGGKLTTGIKKIVAQGPYLLAEKAKKVGLFDDLLYEDEVYKKLKEDVVALLPGEILFHTQDPFPQIRGDWADDYEKRIAVIHASGFIVQGYGNPGSFIGSKSLAGVIRKARKDPFIAGIILRIDSGGGSALASDIIAREVRLATRSDEKKPLIVSMGGTAASGGYYIASYADKIIASPVTITGSIGVLATIPNIAGLLEKVGIGSDTVTTTDSADFFNFFEEPKENDIAKMEQNIAESYKRFVEVVTDGRNMSTEAVEKVAMGKIWTGRQALKLGLVDELGTFADAVNIMEGIVE
jgi:protease-4